MISWRNPDARHAGWDLDTYVQAVLDALDAVERITGTDRTVLAGICSGGILAAHRRRATSPATGRQDRLAALRAGGDRDRQRAAPGTASALADRGLAAAAKAASRAHAATSTAGRWPRCSPGCGRATWSGTTG